MNISFFSFLLGTNITLEMDLDDGPTKNFFFDNARPFVEKTFVVQ